MTQGDLALSLRLPYSLFRPGVTRYLGTGRIGTIPIYPGSGGRIFRKRQQGHQPL